MDAPVDSHSLLLQHLAKGDVRRAAHVLVTHHADEVYGLCRAMVRDATAAEDLSQDVFSRAFAALPEFRGEASVRTWILRIARNRCVDHLRTQRRRPWDAPDAEEPDEPPAVEPTVADLLERREDVRRALDALTEGDRALVVLRYGHGLGYPELADAFGLKHGAVRMRVSRALQRMRAALEAPPAEGAEEDLDLDEVAAARADAPPLAGLGTPAPGGPPSPAPGPAPPGFAGPPAPPVAAPTPAAPPPAFSRPQSRPSGGAPPPRPAAPGGLPPPGGPTGPAPGGGRPPAAPAPSDRPRRRASPAAAGPGPRARGGLLRRVVDAIRGRGSAEPEPPVPRLPVADPLPESLEGRLRQMAEGVSSARE